MAELHVQRKRNNYIWVWVFLILILIGVVIYFYLQSNNGKNQLAPDKPRTGMLKHSPGEKYLL
jgi:TM2 domain-containing membrane protein YozV